MQLVSIVYSSMPVDTLCFVQTLQMSEYFHVHRVLCVYCEATSIYIYIVLFLYCEANDIYIYMILSPNRYQLAPIGPLRLANT